MWILYLINTIAFFIPLLMCLFYSFFIFIFGCLFESDSLKLYARNLALGVSDQGLATIWGQAPDISISEALGLAAKIHEEGDGYANQFVLCFGKFVDWLFWNSMWQIEKNHIRASLDKGESFKNTINHWHFSDKDTNSRDVSKYI